MKKIGSLLRNTSLDTQLISSKQRTIRRSLVFYVLLCLLFGSSCLIIYILNQDLILLICAVLLAMVCLCYFPLRKASIENLNRFNILVFMLGYCSALYLGSSVLNDVSAITFFFQGYCFATLQQIFRNYVLNFKYMAACYIFMLASRTLLIGRLGFQSLLTISYFAQIVLDIIIICMAYKSEQNEKLQIKYLQDYKQEFLNFKDLLTKYLPQNIMVVNRSLTPLFINQPLQKTFDLDQQHPDILNHQIRKILDSLKVERTNLQCSNVSSYVEKLIKDQDHDSVLLKEVVDYLADSYQQRVGILSFESFSDKKQAKILFQVTLFNMVWDQEEAFVIILDDVTQREEVISLRIADANKDKVMATISHELRTPLNGIIGLIQMAEKRSDSPEVSHYLGLCHTNAELLLSIVNSMLDLNQIRQGILRLSPSSVNLEGVLRQMKTLFEFQCIEKGIYMNCELEKNVSRFIVTDENRLKQILINLIGNALKFTFQGGITIKIEEDPNSLKHLLVSVADTGVGVQERDKKKLFKMFGKLEKTESVDKNGIGLGLAISESLAKLLGGQQENEGQSIFLESEEGKGSKFFFRIAKKLSNEKIGNVELENETDCLATESLDMEYKLSKYESLVRKETLLSGLNDFHYLNTDGLPNIELNQRLGPFPEDSPLLKYKSMLLRAQSTLSFQRQDHRNSFNKRTSTGQQLNTSLIQRNISTNGMFKGPWVLVIDDNPFNLLVAQNLLENLEYRVRVSLSGPAGISMIKQHILNDDPFQFILMDCQMPIMDGFETTKQLRELMNQKEIPNTPIIALTANDTGADIQRCYECGMLGHIVKPLKEENLRGTLSKLKQENLI